MSPFEVVYGFNPLTPLDLSPIPQVEQVNLDGLRKGEFVKKLHEKARENILKKTEGYKKQADKGRKALTFEPGEWVWLHMRPERFPHERSSKLAPRGDGPFKVLEKINDNAYRLELPSEFNISHSFNVTDLSPYDADETVLRTKPSEERGNDEDIDPTNPTAVLDPVPEVKSSPMTRSKVRRLRAGFNTAVETLLNTLELGAEFKPPPPQDGQDESAKAPEMEFGTDFARLTLRDDQLPTKQGNSVYLAGTEVQSNKNHVEITSVPQDTAKTSREAGLAQVKQEGVLRTDFGETLQDLYQLDFSGPQGDGITKKPAWTAPGPHSTATYPFETIARQNQVYSIYTICAGKMTCPSGT